MRLPKDPIIEMSHWHGDREFTIESSTKPRYYNILENDEVIDEFEMTQTAISEDHLWSRAREHLAAAGTIEMCSECTSPIDDGEGYDGLCGNCADKSQEYCVDCDEPVDVDGNCADRCTAPATDFSEEYGGAEVNIVRENYMDDGAYEVRDSRGNEIRTFIHLGDEEDHEAVWDSAKAALDESAAAYASFTGIPEGAEVILEPVTLSDSDGDPVIGSRYNNNGREAIILAGSQGTVELWRREKPDAERYDLWNQHDGGLEIHQTEPMYQGQPGYDQCRSVQSGTCYHDGSTLAYEEMKFVFIRDGEDAPRSLMQDYERLKK